MRKINIIVALLLIAVASHGEIYRKSISDMTFTLGGDGIYRANWGSGATPPVTTAGLVLQYLMGDSGDTSNITLDTSGNDYTGTVVNATWNAPTNGIASYYLFAANQYISTAVSNSPLLQTGGQTEMTLSCWSKKTGAHGGGFGVLANQWSATASRRKFLFYEANNSQITLGLNNSATVVAAPTTNDLNVWNEWAFTLNGSSATIYKNGSAVTSAVFSASLFTNAVDDALIGLFYDRAAYDWTGDITMLNWRTDALTAYEIQQTNIQQSAQLGITPQYLADNLDVYSNCVFAWSGNVLQDGSQNHLTMSSASAPTAVNVKPNSVDLPNGNGAYDFNGSANYEAVPDADYYAVTNLTVSVWVNPDTTKADPIQVAVAKSGSSTDRSFAIGLYITTLRGDVVIGSSSGGDNWGEWRGSSSSEDLFDTNAWNMMTFVWDGSQAVTNNRVKLYKNTTLVTSTLTTSGGTFLCPTALYNNNSSVEVGRRRGASTPTGYWNGKIDEPLILSGVSWTPTDVTNYYNATTNLFF